MYQQGTEPGGYQQPNAPPPAPQPQDPPPYSEYPAYQEQAGYNQSAPTGNVDSTDTARLGQDSAFGEGYNFDFTDKSIRRGFIKKVYSILLCQLIVTILFICMFLYIGPLREFSVQNPWLWAIAFVLTIVIIIVLACCPNVRRNWPTNIILLGAFTLCESFLLGAVSSCYEAEEVLMAVGITAVVAFGLTLFAFQTKIDFTMLNGALFVALIVLFCFGLVALIIRSHILNLVYASLGALLFSLYLVFDTQMMMGGKHKYALSPEEYIFAALNLYLDIVNLFMFILSIVGSARN